MSDWTPLKLSPGWHGRPPMTTTGRGTLTCPVWGDLGHNWIRVRGTFLWWRTYRVCCACQYVEREYHRPRDI